MDATINDEPVDIWESHHISAGDVLSFNFSTEGARSYLAVAGGIDVPLMMESRSTYTLIGIGGHEGRSLESGDTLPIGNVGDDSAQDKRRVPEELRPGYSDMDPIRVVMGCVTIASPTRVKRSFWTPSGL